MSTTKDLVKNERALPGLSVKDFMHIQDQKTSGITGGDSILGFQTRTLNTVLTNSIAGASLAASIVTLPAGDYYVEIFAPCFRGVGHKVILKNNTDVVDVLTGKNEYADATNLVQTQANASGLFTIAASKDFLINHYIGAASAGGLGQGVNDASAEIFAEMKIWKVSYYVKFSTEHQMEFGWIWILKNNISLIDSR